MGWEGLGTLVGTIADWFSPKQQIKRMKNELDKLEREKDEIFINKASEKLANRLVYINGRIKYLNKRLSNET